MPSTSTWRQTRVISRGWGIEVLQERTCIRCRSPPPNSKVKNEWSCASAPPVCLHGVDRDNLTFTVRSSFGPAERQNKVAALLLSDADKYIAFLNFNVSVCGPLRAVPLQWIMLLNWDCLFLILVAPHVKVTCIHANTAVRASVVDRREMYNVTSIPFENQFCVSSSTAVLTYYVTFALTTFTITVPSRN
jgi:hypothetical protein